MHAPEHVDAVLPAPPVEASPYRPAAHARHAAADVNADPPMLYVPAAQGNGGMDARQKYPAGHVVAQLPVVPDPATAVPLVHAYPAEHAQAIGVATPPAQENPSGHETPACDEDPDAQYAPATAVHGMHAAADVAPVTS